MKQYKKELGKVSVSAEGKWNIDNAYERISMVFDEHTEQAFISKCDVPAGIDLYNREYWMPLNVSGYSDSNIIILNKKINDFKIKSYSLEEAIKSIKPIGRKPGCILVFYNSNSERLDIGGCWEIWQFNDTNIYNWENVKSWQSIYYNYNKFVGWYSNEESLKKYNPFPEVGCYAYVGSELNNSVVFRCDSKYVWTRTKETAKDYVKVILDGTITIGENGNWYQNGEDTNIPASVKGDDGKTPFIRNINNILEYSYDEIEWKPISEKIAAWFRWKAGDADNHHIGNIQISRDNVTWQNLSGDIVSSLYISKHIGIDEQLPTNVAEGTIIAKRTSSTDTTSYELFVYAYNESNALAWISHGVFTSISVGLIQETGDNENVVMSQKAVTDAIDAEAKRANDAEKNIASMIQQNAGDISILKTTSATKVELNAEVERAKIKEQGIEEKVTELELESVSKNAGKNLLDPQKRHLSNWIDAEGGLANVYNSYGYYDYIKIEGGTTYYLSNKNERTLTDRSDNFIAFYDVNKDFISSQIANTLSFTSPSEAVYVRISFDVAKEEGLEPMLNIGSSRGKYEPYNPIDGYLGEIDELKNVNKEQDKRTTIIESKVGYAVSDTEEINNSEGVNLIETLIPANTPFKWKIISDNINGRIILDDNTGTRLYDGQNANTWYEGEVDYDISILRLSNYSGNTISAKLEIKWGMSLDVENIISQKIESEDVPRIEYISKDISLSAGGSFDSFGSFLCGWGYGTSAGQYVTITPTEIQIYDRGETSSLNHGLTIDKYITVAISTNSKMEAFILIQSGNGQNYYNKMPWMGRGIPFSTFRGSENAVSHIRIMRRRIQSPIWIYGDSYMTYDSSYRWTWHMLYWGFENWHANHVPGGKSEGLMPAFQADLLCGKPQYALWLLGMNDGSDDDINTPSETWMNNILKFISICHDKNITPILATIPSVPTIYHEGKNKWVRESGYRYIDFAEAVGASADGQWTSGMLYEDGVHPEPLGARALAMRVLYDFPEITIV